MKTVLIGRKPSNNNSASWFRSAFRLATVPGLGVLLIAGAALQARADVPPPVIRQSGKKFELLVPVRFKGNSAKFVQEYQW